MTPKQKAACLLIDENVYTACFVEGATLKLQTLVKINDPRNPVRVSRLDNMRLWLTARKLLLE